MSDVAAILTGMSRHDDTRQRTERAAREHVAAFNAHDTARLLAGFTADARWATGQDVFVGTAALADLFDAGLWALDPALEVLSLVVGEDRAAAELRETLTFDGEVRTFTVAVFLDVDGDGLIRRGRVYREGSADLD